MIQSMLWAIGSIFYSFLWQTLKCRVSKSIRSPYFMLFQKAASSPTSTFSTLFRTFSLSIHLLVVELLWMNKGTFLWTNKDIKIFRVHLYDNLYYKACEIQWGNVHLLRKALLGTFLTPLPPASFRNTMDFLISYSCVSISWHPLAYVISQRSLLCQHIESPHWGHD